MIPGIAIPWLKTTILGHLEYQISTGLSTSDKRANNIRLHLNDYFNCFLKCS